MNGGETRCEEQGVGVADGSMVQHHARGVYRRFRRE